MLTHIVENENDTPLTPLDLTMSSGNKELDKEVLKLLEEVGASHLKDVFIREGVTISELVDLTEDDLAKIGVDKLLQRRRIFKAARQYKNKMKRVTWSKLYNVLTKNKKKEKEKQGR